MLEHMRFPHDISTFGPPIDLLFVVVFLFNHRHRQNRRLRPHAAFAP